MQEKTIINIWELVQDLDRFLGDYECKTDEAVIAMCFLLGEHAARCKNPKEATELIENLKKTIARAYEKTLQSRK